MGLTLGAVLAVAVAAVLGLITGLDLHRELVMERTMGEARLEERVVELAEELAEVHEVARLPVALARFRARAEQTTGAEHGLELRDGAGRTVAAAPGGGFRPPRGALEAIVEIDSPALETGHGQLAAWQSDEALAADRARLWRDWTMDLLLTSFGVILIVELTVHLLVGRPLRRLVSGLRRFELGHMGPIDTGSGAWEIRWLAWRFERLGQELANNARRLVAAERRALDTTRFLVATQGETPTPTSAGDGPTISASHSEQNALARQYLEDTCRFLENLDPRDVNAQEIAKNAWTSAVVEAERLGDGELKAQLEDGALRILERETFADLDADLKALRKRRLPWTREVGDSLAEALIATGVTIDEIQQRVKHTAGVWRKMREAQLTIDQVHDLFAFRIIVETESDCYVALAAVHRSFDPEPFRFKDYIQSPKANGYRSLHTTVRDAEGRLFEVQIRTRKMHEAAESGGAAHWRYRTARWGSLDQLRERRSWFRRWFKPRERSAR